MQICAMSCIFHRRKAGFRSKLFTPIFFIASILVIVHNAISINAQFALPLVCRILAAHHVIFICHSLMLMVYLETFTLITVASNKGQKCLFEFLVRLEQEVLIACSSTYVSLLVSFLSRSIVILGCKTFSAK